VIEMPLLVSAGVAGKLRHRGVENVGIRGEREFL
jgi:hypothetical protein